MMIYIFIQVLKIINMTKKGCTKQVAYVDDFIVLFEEALNFLLNKN